MFSALLKLTIYIAIIGIFTHGLRSKSEVIPKIAAYLFLVAEVVRLVTCYREAKAYRTGTWEPKSKGWLEKAASLLRNIIIIGGLLLCLDWNTVGIIIWCGFLVSYIASGVITERVACIPVKMTYGGWAADRKRRSRRK
ncbi:MAG: hypothetical protein ACREA2_22740 [Blastocatellia bacterium]